MGPPGLRVEQAVPQAQIYSSATEKNACFEEKIPFGLKLGTF
tara:strand:+ start:343 stop:468 length:126 start_codon:yes stop_codon:yes gene_type:complete